MTRQWALGVLAGVATAVSAASASAGVSFGISVGGGSCGPRWGGHHGSYGGYYGGFYGYRPYCPPPVYYRPRPVYYYPAPVCPPPVVVVPPPCPPRYVYPARSSVYFGLSISDRGDRDDRRYGYGVGYESPAGFDRGRDRDWNETFNRDDLGQGYSVASRGDAGRPLDTTNSMSVTTTSPDLRVPGYSVPDAPRPARAEVPAVASVPSVESRVQPLAPLPATSAPLPRKAAPPAWSSRDADRLASVGTSGGMPGLPGTAPATFLERQPVGTAGALAQSPGMKPPPPMSGLPSAASAPVLARRGN